MRLNPLAAAMAQKPMQSVALNMSPQTALPEPPKNALLQGIGAAIDGFQRGFDPKAWQAGKDEAKAAEGEKLKQTLALMQQQRALPEQQRGQWWQQNAPTISKIIGQDVSQMPLDVTKFSDQALDGQIAALSAQMGIGPATPEPVQYQGMNLGDGGVGAFNPATGKMDVIREPAPKPGTEKLETKVGDNGNYWTFNTATGKMEDTGVKAPVKAQSNGINLSFGEDGGLAGLSIGGPQMQLGGTGQKGKEPAVIRSPDGRPIVSPSPQQLAANKDWQRIQSGESQNRIVLDSITKAKNLISPWTTGPGASLKDLPIVGQSTDAGTLANLLTTIKTNLGFDKLDEMRANSPTGAALGNVTEKELTFLQAVRGSLEQGQKDTELRQVLKQVEDFVKGRDAARREAFAQDYPELAEFAGFAKRTSNEVKRLSKDINKAVQEYNALKKGDRYIDDDGIERTKQ